MMVRCITDQECRVGSHHGRSRTSCWFFAWMIKNVVLVVAWTIKNVVLVLCVDDQERRVGSLRG